MGNNQIETYKMGNLNIETSPINRKGGSISKLHYRWAGQLSYHLFVTSSNVGLL